MFDEREGASSTPPSRRGGGLRWHDAPTGDLLRGPGYAVVLDGCRLEYLACAAPSARDRPPLVLFGGAFQTFWSHRREVERLSPHRALILLNLPGQGTNLAPSAGLTFSDLAELTAAFLDRVGIDRVVPVGLSYGSAIAHRFATRHRERTDLLILGGISPRLQPSLRSLLRAGRWLLDQGRVEEWAWSCVLHLLNLEARQQTGVSDDLVSAFHRSLVRLPAEARERWWVNSERLFTEELTDAPYCRTLVLGSRHDHFMPPYQAAEVAAALPDGQFCLLTHADHLAPLERGEDVIDLYEAFLEGRPIATFPWLEHGDAAFAAVRDRRVVRRAGVPGARVTVRDSRGVARRGVVHDLSHHGAALVWDAQGGEDLGLAPLRVRLDETGTEVHAVTCPGSDGGRLRFLFTGLDTRATWAAAVDRTVAGALA